MANGLIGIFWTLLLLCLYFFFVTFTMMTKKNRNHKYLGIFELDDQTGSDLPGLRIGIRAFIKSVSESDQNTVSWLDPGTLAVCIDDPHTHRFGESEL